MTTDWILRVGNGENLISSSKYKIWGIQSTTSFGKHFLNNVQTGDRLWFIKSKSSGKIIAVATYCSHNTRELGPLINISLTNEDLGWVGEGPDWTSDVEIHYKDLYWLSECDLLTHIKGPTTIRKYDDKCKVDLVTEYNNIIKYSKIRFGL
jgi:hypothetical protein